MRAFLLGVAVCWAALTGATWFMESATLRPRGALHAWIASLLLAPMMVTALACFARARSSALIARGGRRAFAWGLVVGSLGCALAGIGVIAIGDRPASWGAPAIAAAVAAIAALLLSPRADPLACVRCGYDLRQSPGRCPCPECGAASPEPRSEDRGPSGTPCRAQRPIG